MKNRSQSFNPPDLSIVLPGIRKEHWPDFYQSIFKSIGKYSFELIIVGPHKPDDFLLKENENISWIEDYGSPVRCQNIRHRKIGWTILYVGC